MSINRKRYSPLKENGGMWTLDLEQEKVSELPVAGMIDALIVKIRNSNGLDFCTTEQVQALIKELRGEPS